MNTTQTNLSSLTTDDGLIENDLYLDETLFENMELDLSDLYLVPLNYLCTVNRKLTNYSVFSLLRLAVGG